MATLLMAVMHAVDESGEHLFGHCKIINRAAANRAIDFGITRLASQKFVRFRSDGEDLARVFVNRYRRWLVQNDASVRRVDERVHCSEINCQIVCEKVAENSHALLGASLKKPEGESLSSLRRGNSYASNEGDQSSGKH